MGLGGRLEFDSTRSIQFVRLAPCGAGVQVRRPVFQRIFWDLGPGQKPDISLEKYKTVIKLLVAATVGCQGAKN
jgi:hypothetical protein